VTIKRVIFIRPGETDWNRQGRYQGWVAVPLNEHGRKQVMALANFIRNIGVTALYSSDLKRAIDTAMIIGEKLGYEPVFDQRLRERAVGSWQGLTLNEITTWYAEDYAKLRQEPNEYRMPFGESLNDVTTRILEIFTQILSEDKGETIGVVSHTTAIRALLAELIPSYDQSNLIFGNSSVTTIYREGDEWCLTASNDVMHLEGLESRSVGEFEVKK
jgi:broad specificity phosphatase PhoE